MRRTLFEPEHDEYRAVVRAFLEREVVPHYAQWQEEGITPRSLFRRLGDLGALGMGVAEEYGGTGIRDFRFNAVLGEEAARLGVAPAVLGAVLVADICIPYFTQLGTADQCARWLPGLTSGELVCAIAMTEPGAGSDLTGISTRAVRDGDDWVIDGAKMFITNGRNADLVIVAARTGEDRRRGLSLFVVEAGAPGFVRGRALHKLGLHAQDTAELVFDGVRVGADQLLGEVGGGLDALTDKLAQERLSVAVGAIAAAAAALETTTAHVRDREAFGGPLARLQTVRVALAEMSTEVDVAQAFVDHCVLAHNAGELDPVDAAKAKWWSTEMQGRVVDRCLQLHGGYGYMSESAIAQAWADARVSRIYGGATEVLKDLIGRALSRG